MYYGYLRLSDNGIDRFTFEVIMVTLSSIDFINFNNLNEKE